MVRANYCGSHYDQHFEIDTDDIEHMGGFLVCVSEELCTLPVSSRLSRFMSLIVSEANDRMRQTSLYKGNPSPSASDPVRNAD